MTAEIAIMNKEAIALAADSAATFSGGSGQKIFPSANKLFMLSKYHPVGIMIYGNALFMGIPWETIIKVYRNKIGTKKFEKLQEYSKDFINFLDSQNPLFPESSQDNYVKESVVDYFNFLKKSIKDQLHSEIDENSKLQRKRIKQIISQILQRDYDRWQNTKAIPSLPTDYEEQVLIKYRDFIDKSIKDVFQDVPFSKTEFHRIELIASRLFSRFPVEIDNEGISGVVVAGFGQADTFPSLISYRIECVVINRLKYDVERTDEIDYSMSASMSSFAQGEMVTRFMEGIDPDLQNHINGYLKRIFDGFPDVITDSVEKYSDEEKVRLKNRLKEATNNIVTSYHDHIDSYKRANYIDPIINVVEGLPKDELAAMAESLVNLTSFKRRVSMESETVGGPIDVAVISKGDGFVWIKRKHYFRPELNPQFFANYYREV